MLLDAEIINKKHFFLLYFTTEDMKFLKMEKKDSLQAVSKNGMQHGQIYPKTGPSEKT